MKETLQELVSSALRLSTPLLLAATGEMVSEKAGVLNLSLEGMMLSAAF
ncbi:MAG TPA: ABC transporter permease, partial [Polyangia bacterium]|nr:ABC transporter permease [Polyangia bacterium]